MNTWSIKSLTFLSIVEFFKLILYWYTRKMNYNNKWEIVLKVDSESNRRKRINYTVILASKRRGKEKPKE